MSMDDRLRIKQEGRARMRLLSFGDPVTNVCAGDGNPLRHGFFVKIKGDCAQITDKRGKFANIECPVIYPGHLSVDESERLFEPYWVAQFGERHSKQHSEER